MNKCLICAADVETFISFGDMPIANGFLTEEEFADEYFFELKVGFCPDCKMVQLTELVDPEALFHGHYSFYSSTSARMAEHFKEFAGEVETGYLSSDDPFVVEIGSNDGIMLRNFAGKGIRHLGIEPSSNVAEAAREQGVDTLCAFFSEKLAEEIVSEHGLADAILGANVMCHIPDLHSVAAGFKSLLKPDGIVMFEDPYLGDIVQKCSYDQIYDEHVFYFSATSINRLFSRHGLELVDVKPQTVHGGSMRYIICHSGARKPSATVEEMMLIEREMGLHDRGTYRRLRERIENSGTMLVNLLEEIRGQGDRVVGYAATSKSTTVLNYCRIGPELIEFISDTTPIKMNKFSPGMHIPVKNYSEFLDNYPEYALLFAWNHKEEILAKEGDFFSSGGRFIVYVPEVKVEERR